MPKRRSESVLSTLGVGPADERRYQQVLPLSGSPVAAVAAALAGRLSPACAARSTRDAPGPGRGGRGGASDRRPPHAALRDRRDPCDRARAPGLRRLPAPAGAAGSAGGRADAAVRAPLGARR